MNFCATHHRSHIRGSTCNYLQESMCYRHDLLPNYSTSKSDGFSSDTFKQKRYCHDIEQSAYIIQKIAYDKLWSLVHEDSSCQRLCKLCAQLSDLSDCIQTVSMRVADRFGENLSSSTINGNTNHGLFGSFIAEALHHYKFVGKASSGYKKGHKSIWKRKTLYTFYRVIKNSVFVYLQRTKLHQRKRLHRNKVSETHCNCYLLSDITHFILSV